MNILSRLIVWAFFCCVAIVVGRLIAHTVAPTGAPDYGYALSAQSSVNPTAVAVAQQTGLSAASSPVVLTPRPTKALVLPITQSLHTTVATATHEIRSTIVKPTASGAKQSISTATPYPPTASPTEAPTATSVVKATPGGAYFTYTVKKGDTLLGIAKSFNISAKDILAINDIPDPASLQVGDVIHIPAREQ